MEQLDGIVESITFQSGDGGFVVFKLQPFNGRGLVTAVGNVSAPLVGEQVEMSGDWIEHVRFGRQFKVVTYKRTAPSNEKGIERFLASGAVRGIGPSLAGRMVKQFGAKTLEIIEFAPHRLVEVEGIGQKKADMIYSSYAEQAEMREVMLFLEMHGVTGTYAAKIFQHYGSTALEVLKENPYRLAAEVQGIGFRTADLIAMSLGLEKNHPARLAAGIQFALLQTGQAGHSCVPENLLVEESAKLLGVEQSEAASVLTEMIREESLFTEDYHGMLLIYPKYLYYAEKSVAEMLLSLRDMAKPVKETDFSRIVANWEAAANIKLAQEQRKAVESSLEHGVLVLTGGPGTGKTVTVKGILSVLEKQDFKILLGAPTGRAAKRLSEATGREAMTIHRLLESTGGSEGAPFFMRNEDDPLDADVIIVDEVSMMDISLMAYFLRAVPSGCRVVLVGDVDQLPAVGPGAVLKDIIRSETVPVVRLTEIFRQDGESTIVLNAHRINRGMEPDCSHSDFQFVEQYENQDVVREIVNLCRDVLPQQGFDSFRDIQVLSPMHRQECGVENLNKVLQEALNPASPGKGHIVGINQVLREGDKVMQIRNNYSKNVFNGDIGFIRYVDDEMVLVRYPDNEVAYEKGEIDELHLAYAMSVHKSQGSEYPAVVMPLVPGHRIMLQRNLLYTAVTRAKEKVVLLGAKAALNTALANDRTKRRYSLLAERLRRDCL